MLEEVPKEELERTRSDLKKLKDKANELLKCINGEISPEILKAKKDSEVAKDNNKRSDSYKSGIKRLLKNANPRTERAAVFIIQRAYQLDPEKRACVIPGVERVIYENLVSKNYDSIIGFSEVLLSLKKGSEHKVHGKKCERMKEIIFEKYSKLHMLKDNSMYEKLNKFVNMGGTVEEVYNKIEKMHYDWFKGFRDLKSKK